ncbi:MAG: acylneuraminate cytidylyltransferase family protein [Candidatus Heimdallarchaeum endolithica]|uniref:Acylneuraminate cytidylyltransferase family protein n=1 Tax=Candidatus Heimdallarchaeum endolithica TaxID=2876572 RepID=A0A9Y1FPC2_9ARCH|nr:MAG: acylneuraminate cytidylyltransferase family protein [Candidatus Heimdallarchaeum endolithica]
MTFKNYHILAIIPARRGSKGIKNKNLQVLKNRTLIEWSILHAKKSKYIDEIVLTTDDEKAIEIGKKNEICTIERPETLASDTSPMKDVILHTLEIKKGYEIFVLLQPTSPLRTSEDVDKTIELLCSGSFHSCISICEFEPHPFLAVSKEDKYIKFLFNNKNEYFRRQDFPKFYRINGAIYTVYVQKFLKDSVFLKEEHSTYYEMPLERSIDIDNIIDLKLSEILAEELFKI